MRIGGPGNFQRVWRGFSHPLIPNRGKVSRQTICNSSISHRELRAKCENDIETGETRLQTKKLMDAVSAGVSGPVGVWHNFPMLLRPRGDGFPPLWEGGSLCALIPHGEEEGRFRAEIEPHLRAATAADQALASAMTRDKDRLHIDRVMERYARVQSDSALKTALLVQQIKRKARQNRFPAFSIDWRLPEYLELNGAAFLPVLAALSNRAQVEKRLGLLKQALEAILAFYEDTWDFKKAQSDIYLYTGCSCCRSHNSALNESIWDVSTTFFNEVCSEAVKKLRDEFKKPSFDLPAVVAYFSDLRQDWPEILTERIREDFGDEAYNDKEVDEVVGHELARIAANLRI